jgi:hypothetical protein
MRRCLLGLMGLSGTLGCIVEPDTGESGYGGPSGASLDTDDTSGGTAETTGDGSGSESSTGSTGTGTESSSSTDTGTFVPGDTGGGDDPYPPCPDGMCPGGGTCLTGEGPNAGKSYCAPTCQPAGDPGTCPEPGDGDATPICITVTDMNGQNPTSYCALDCSGGQTCPAGKTCVDETDANGAIKICL